MYSLQEKTVNENCQKDDVHDFFSHQSIIIYILLILSITVLERIIQVFLSRVCNGYILEQSALEKNQKNFYKTLHRINHFLKLKTLLI